MTSWFERGFTDLVSVIPPSATLSPLSKISQTALGKSPGRRNRNGTWGGYGWLAHEPTADDVRQWLLDGANLGLKASRFPAVDIDVTDPWLAQLLVADTEDALGATVVRTGRAPKALLMYRLSEEVPPFPRMALTLTDPETKQAHLVEVLGHGRQFLVQGTHPSGTPYTWRDERVPSSPWDLPAITQADVERLFARLTTTAETYGYVVARLGDERVRERSTVEQASLRAPSEALLTEVVTAIPNPQADFPERGDYIRLLYAIKAAAEGVAEDDGFALFSAWAERWDGGTNEPETILADWRRAAPPYTIGWDYLLTLARRYGVNTAALEFPPEPAPVDDREPQPPEGSDIALAHLVIDQHGDHLRFVSQWGRFYVFDGTRWVADATSLSEHRVGATLLQEADRILRIGATTKEQAAAIKEGKRLCAATTRAAVQRFVVTDPRLAIRPESFDADPWVLNTPTGIVDLTTGTLAPHSAGALLTKQTAAGPEFDGACPTWRRFLAEATGGDAALEAYLQRVAGYCLTGSTKEQVLIFVWGPGGNGKSVFLNTLTTLLGDYARQAPMDMFVASTSDRHPTELAALQGARLVAASETQGGRRWDEARMKSLTGGDPISARFMRQDYFTYQPQFKLVFVGNHKPDIRDVDPAMRRRVQLVPFTVTPARVDKELAATLRDEYPAILAWAIQGCLQWQAQGLSAPASVRQETAEYFDDQDGVGRWLAECTTGATAGEGTTTTELFASWREWANANGEFVGTARRLAQALTTRRFERWRQADTRRKGFLGLALKPSLEFTT